MPTTSQPARLQELKNFVNGEFSPVMEDRTSDIVDPSTGEAYASRQSLGSRRGRRAEVRRGRPGRGGGTQPRRSGAWRC